MPIATPGRWVSQNLGRDRFAAAFASGEQTVALVDAGEVGFRLLVLGANFSWEQLDDHTPAVDGEEFEGFDWTDLAVTRFGVVVAGYAQVPPPRGSVRHYPAFAVATDIDGPFEFSVLDDAESAGSVLDIVESVHGLIAVGRTETGRGYGPGVWMSADGRSWTPIEIDDGELDVTQLANVAAHGQVLVAAARNNQRTDPPVVFVSSDGGTWRPVALPEVGDGEAVHGIHVAHDGERFIVIGSATEESTNEVIWTSVDGSSWARLAPQPEVFGDGGTSINAAHSATQIAVALGATVYRASPLYCYDDLTNCQRRYIAVWISLDGSWHRVDIPDDSGFGLYDAGYDGDAFYFASATGDDGVIWTWIRNDDTLVDVVAEPFDTSPPSTDLPLAGEHLDTGVVYASPLDYGCWRFEILGRFNDQWWVATSKPDSVPETWPIRELPGVTPTPRTLYGTLELVADDLIEYSVPGEGVVATYAPAAPDFHPWGCF